MSKPEFGFCVASVAKLEGASALGDVAIVAVIEAIPVAGAGDDRRGLFATEPDSAPRGNENVAAALFDMMVRDCQRVETRSKKLEIKCCRCRKMQLTLSYGELKTADIATPAR